MAESGRKTFRLDGKKIDILPGPAGAPVLYLNAFMDEASAVAASLAEAPCPAHSLVVVSSLDWDDDMTPWYCPPLGKGDAPCGGGAEQYLGWMLDTLLPRAESALGAAPAWRALTGYSLAGLFAVWALYRTDAFTRAGSMSGSLWYPDFRGYVMQHEPAVRPDCLYFSLGDREAKTRHPLLKTVQENTEAIAEHFRVQGIETEFVLNPGNHYKNADGRTAAGLRWLLTHGPAAAGTGNG